MAWWQMLRASKWPSGQRRRRCVDPQSRQSSLSLWCGMSLPRPPAAGSGQRRCAAASRRSVCCTEVISCVIICIMSGAGAATTYRSTCRSCAPPSYAAARCCCRSYMSLEQKRALFTLHDYRRTDCLAVACTLAGISSKSSTPRSTGQDTKQAPPTCKR